MLVVGDGEGDEVGVDPAVFQAMVKSSYATSAQLENRNKAIKKCKFCIDETVQSC